MYRHPEAHDMLGSTGRVIVKVYWFAGILVIATLALILNFVFNR